MNKTSGYARVSTRDQNLDTQLDIVTKAGCDYTFRDKITGMSLQQLALDELLGLLREGDTVLVLLMVRLFQSAGRCPRPQLVRKPQRLGHHLSQPAALAPRRWARGRRLSSVA
ncbi:MAG: recombinase family protein [Janthinobacterium lividum]